MNQDKYECVNVSVYKFENVKMYECFGWFYCTDALINGVRAA